MLRTIFFLALALVVHVTLVATLAHACGPHCSNRQSNYSNSNQHVKPQFQLGNRANIGNKNGLSHSAEAARLPLTTTASEPATNKALAQSTDHPADLPTNAPPLAASK